MTLNSAHTENILNKLNKNIKVIRYPSHREKLRYLSLLWSNHEKLVIIDQVIGYIGGLDLCWGRYDNNQHPFMRPQIKRIYMNFHLLIMQIIELKIFQK